jgi:hypothetical protein
MTPMSMWSTGIGDVEEADFDLMAIGGKWNDPNE